MARSGVLYAALGATTVLLAGCIGGDGGHDNGDSAQGTALTPAASVDVLTDPGGDARLNGRDATWTSASSPCGLAERARAACEAAGRPTFDAVVPEDFGRDAPPSLDILGVRFVETADTLTVELTMAEVQDTFADAMTSVPENKMADFSVCWSATGWRDDTGECVYTQVLERGGPILFVMYDVYDPDCNYWWWCSWSVDFEIEAGTPGVLRWEIPRALMPAGDQGDVLEWVEAGATLRADVYGGATAWSGAGYNLADPRTDPGSRLESGRIMPFMEGQSVDGTEVGAFTFMTAASSRELYRAPWSGEVGSPEGTISPTDDEAYDLRTFRFVEREDTITLASKMARVDERPADGLALYVGLGLPSGAVYDIGAHAAGGEWTAYAFAPRDPEFEEYEELPIELAVEPGSPGWINLTLVRSDMELLYEGDVVNLLEPVITSQAAVPGVVGVPAGPLAAYAFRPGGLPIVDFIVNAPPYTFRFGGARPDDGQPSAGLPGHAAAVDAVDDAVQPGLGLLPSNVDRYDVTYVEAADYAPDTSLLLLGVKDLSDARSVPDGYSALVYAGGISGAQGDYMAGYFSTASGEQGFFCGADTLVFLAAKTDPTQAPTTPIQGTVGASGQRGTQAPDRPGTSISLYVPDTCLGAGPGNPPLVDVLAAGTYVVRQTPGGASEVETLDDVLASFDEPIPTHAIATADAGPTAPTWYDSPFGIGEFWNIAGIVGAGGMAIGGVAAIRRKRSVLREYLHELEHAASIPDAGQREAAFHDIRRDLKEDLVSGHISEGHYVIVERRLDESLAKVRLADLAEAFDDLPHGLLVKLQSMLRDGVMSREDYRLFTSYLDRSSVTKSGQAAIRRRLEVWVAEDSGT